MNKPKTLPASGDQISLTIKVRTDIVNDLKKMQENTRHTIEDLVTKALLMFIATHKDYLGSDKLD